MADEERKRTPPELARAKQLAERSATDLRLLADATRGLAAILGTGKGSARGNRDQESALCVR